MSCLENSSEQDREVRSHNVAILGSGLIGDHCTMTLTPPHRVQSVPTTRYARSGDVNIAYQAVGSGPPDLVYVPGWVTNVEVMWEDPNLAGFMRRLSSFSRLVTFDKRGVGLSDPVPLGELPGLDARVQDLQAVMDDADVGSATIFGHSAGGTTAIAYAARHPERVERLILFGCYAKRLWSQDYPWAPTPEERAAESKGYEESWADPTRIADFYAPSRAGDAAFIQWLGRWLRLSASPKAAAALNDASTKIDVRDLLADITAPTLLLYRIEDRDVKIEEGRYIASKIPDSRLVELHGADHYFYAGDTEPILQEIEEFVTGYRAGAQPDHVLATVLFTDIVQSTNLASGMGDRRWRDLIARHNAVIRGELARWRGNEVVTTGDGFLATFANPTDAIHCAMRIVEAVQPLGIDIRCGLHTGILEVMEHDVTGLAVNIGARIADLAGAGEVFVSRTVRDLVAGAGFELEDRGEHELKGVPDRWHVFAVIPKYPKQGDTEH
jgi:pimeloyl-ACP methyl ester carboxylesterase